MSSLVYIPIISVLFTSALTSQPGIPLKCFLQDGNFFDIFDKTTVQTSQKVRTLPQIDNLKISTINLDKDGFVIDTTNVEYVGLDEAILDDFGFDFVHNVARVTFHTDVLVRCLYKANGTLFSEPIYGDGFVEVFIKNIQFGLTTPFESIESNDKKYINLKNLFYWYDAKDYAQFKLDNLYYGNKDKSDTMHYLMNQNWKYMMTHFGDIYMEKIAENVFNTFKNYLLDVPLKTIDMC